MASDYERIRADNVREYGEGTRHLSFLGRLYSDRTHFIFELLQNAEDAGATNVRFDLERDRLLVMHNGRLFDERDVRGICGVGDSTKTDDITKIGKFGIGFKSVYAYTTCPEVHSGDEHFRVEHYVRPHATTDREPIPKDTTLFVFPFDHPDVDANQAYDEIASRLCNLDVEVLLFLHQVRKLTWHCADGAVGSCQRRDLSSGKGCREVELRRVDGAETLTRWLVFERPVAAPDGARTGVEIAFKLDTDPKTSKEVVVPLERSHLVVYFPTEKETHLGFLIQGPFQTTPARDNIPMDTAWNQYLIEETGTLIVEALRALRDRGLLTVGVLQAMPIRKQYFEPGSMFYPLYAQVRHALRTERLWPASDGRFVEAAHAKLARSSALMDLLTPSQLGELLGKAIAVYWLSSDISEVRTQELYRYLTGHLTSGQEPLVEGIEMRPETFLTRLTPEFMEQQSDEWVALLYEFLDGVRELLPTAKRKEIIRLEDGRQVAPFAADGTPQAYLPGHAVTDYPTVSREIADYPPALDFLKRLGLTEPSALTEVTTRIIPLYAAGCVPLDDSRHIQDLSRIHTALQTVTGRERRPLVDWLRRTPFLIGRNAATNEREYRPPDQLFVATSELETYFGGNERAWFLDDAPELSDEDLRSLGARTALPIHRHPTDPLGYVPSVEQFGEHERGLDGFDPRCSVDELKFALEYSTPERAALIWNDILVPLKDCIRGIVERSSRQTFEHATRTQALSPLGRAVTSTAWLPDRSGDVHRPNELSLEELPDSFKRDVALTKALGMRLGNLQGIAEELDVPVELIHFLRTHPNLVEEVWRKTEQADKKRARVIPYHQALAEAFARPGVTDEVDCAPTLFPVANPERRRDNVSAEIRDAMDREQSAEPRFRQVPRKVWEGKDQVVRAFLLNQYGGHCQICGFTFRQRNGSPYFEGVYLVSYKDHGWIDRPGNVICLCANCSARFQYGAFEAYDVLKQIEEFRASAEGGDGEAHLTVLLTGKEEIIHFSERHMIDLQQMIRESELTSTAGTAMGLGTIYVD